MDWVFLHAALVQPPVILGRGLRPFCAGHTIVLEALGNPFVTGAPKDLAALAQAVFVCSRTFEEGVAAINLVAGEDPDTRKLERYCRKWGRKERRVDATVEIERFEAYIDEYSEAPELWDEPGDKDLRAPYPYLCAMGALAACSGSISLSEAWNMSICLAACLAATAGNLAGSERLMTPEDKERVEAARTGANKTHSPGAGPVPQALREPEPE